MKSVVMKSLRLTCLLSLILACTSLAASAQGVTLQLESLDKLEARADESFNISLDGSLLEIAKKFLRSDKPDEAAIKDLVSGLKGVYVKVFEFAKEGEYTAADLDPIRSQLRALSWTKMAGIKSRKEGENLEVYMIMTGPQVGGIAVISTDPKRLSVVNIAGSIDLEKLIQLGGKFGIPSIQITTDKKEPKQ